MSKTLRRCLPHKEDKTVALTTCSGLGHPIAFYVECVWTLQGTEVKIFAERDIKLLIRLVHCLF